jgi:hypothetical protein
MAAETGLVRDQGCLNAIMLPNEIQTRRKDAPLPKTNYNYEKRQRELEKKKKKEEKEKRKQEKKTVRPQEETVKQPEQSS